ncbi:Regulatory protein RecX [Alteracholeplasma palmae J233]|uniref:Regulatory protein RecX n=1 Tax=Alteracholeplasma palmae (strain ATCC 49389 / J233) TaxID=1318466 RepID=U4KK59_ALTPJ|nr:RecX family transcriptional regulator [Alteracholeplasma palmae]CCV64044.1 Regulatory protein RecX [Alteracholeplasma palmae J233]
MKIEKISKKGKNYQVKLEENELILTEDTILFFRLTKDKEVSHELMEEIINKNNYYLIYQKTLNKLKNPKSSYELIKFLRQNEVSENNIEEIISELKNKKLINDEKLIKNIIEYTNKSRNQIKNKLTQKGFSESEYNEYLMLKDDTDQLEKEFLKLVKKNQKLSSEVASKKITQSLLTKGYSYNKISDVMSQLDNYIFSDEKIKQDITKFRQKYQDDAKVIKKLLSLGYTYETIKKHL